MTVLNKTIRRETDVTVEKGKYRGRKIILSLEPTQILTVRIKGTRQSYSLRLEDVYAYALRMSMVRTYKDRVKEYDLRKKAGLRCRKPVRPDFF